MQAVQEVASVCRRINECADGPHLPVHPNIINSSPRRQQQSLSGFGVGPLHPCSNSCQEQITSLVSNTIVANMLPMSLVESPEFHVPLAFLEPGYKQLCQQTCDMQDELQAHATAVTITTDIWMSLANCVYQPDCPLHTIMDDADANAGEHTDGRAAYSDTLYIMSSGDHF